MAFKDYIPFLKSKPESKPYHFVGTDEKEYRFIEQLTNFKLSELDDFDSYLKATTSKVWSSFKACDITANTVLQTKFDVINRAGSTISNTELENLFNQPNPYETFEEMLYLTAFHIKATGNAYWLKDKLDSKGRPKYLWPLLPQYVKIEAHKDSKIKNYEYTINGESLYLKPEEVIHFKRPNPNDSIFGLGDIEASESLFKSSINNDTYSQSFFKNGAFPSGILVREEYDGDEVDWERMKHKWANEYTGKGSQGKTAWLNGKWKYIQLGLSNKELQTIEQASLNVEQIFLAHGVPLSVAGVKESSNYATARQDYINFRRHTVLPLVQMIFSRLNHPSGLIPSFNPEWSLSFQLSGLIDVEQATKDYELLVKYGAMSLNEYRRVCGLDDTEDENHERFYCETTRVPLEWAGAESILMSERYRFPSDQELNDTLEDNEIQLPDDPEKNPEEESKGHHPDTAYFEGKEVLIINPAQKAYSDYPNSAKENAKTASAYRKNNTCGGTKKLWSINESLVKNSKLSLEDIEYIAKKSNLIKACGESYEVNNQSCQLDAVGSIGMIRWAQEKFNNITKTKINWHEKAKQDAPNYTNDENSKNKCLNCIYSKEKNCTLYNFKYDINGSCSDYKNTE